MYGKFNIKSRTNVKLSQKMKYVSSHLKPCYFETDLKIYAH